VPAVLAAAVLLTGCAGGGSSAVTDTTTQPPARALGGDELLWARKLELFARRLVPELRRLERLTGGSAKIGTVGTRVDRRVFGRTATRRQLEATLTALEACGTVLRATVPRAPTQRLRRVRATVVHACDQLEQAASILRADVLTATSRAGIAPGALEEASQRAGEGVRSLAGALSTLQTLARAGSG
jgi:hypothetical protein